MKVAICSLSAVTHVAEALEGARRLSRSAHVRYFVGFHSDPTVRLLREKGLEHELLCPEEPPGHPPMGSTDSTFRLIHDLFIEHARRVLPRLLPALASWQPDLILAHLRDYAGATAAELLGTRWISFGSCASPIRIEGVDPPWCSGLGRRASAAVLRLIWQRHRRLTERIVGSIDRLLRRPHGLQDLRKAAFSHPARAVLLGTIEALSAKVSPDPPHVRYLGPFHAKALASPDSSEERLLARIAESPRPRLLVSLGTIHGRHRLLPCLDALAGFPGTIVACGGTISRSQMPNVLAHPFIADLTSVLRHSDAVVTVGGHKTVLLALESGKPMICLPCQGEQLETSRCLEELGAAEVPCWPRWTPTRLAAAARRIVSETSPRRSAQALQAQIARTNGAEDLAGTALAIGNDSSGKPGSGLAENSPQSGPR